MPLTMVSSGSVISLMASGAFSPSARTAMSTIGTEICGSSSRGRTISAIRPKTSAAMRISGVRAEVMKLRVSAPAMPSAGPVPDSVWFGMSGNDNRFAGGKAGQDFNISDAAALHDLARHHGTLDVLAILPHAHEIES